MNDIELYLKTKQAQLNEYEGKLKELKSSLSPTDAKANAELDERIKTVETKLEDGKSKLEALSKATKEELDAHKKAIDESFQAIYTHLAMS
ncbi:hypothetical protein [Arcobacter sp. F2176]|uniref:hypothetical protein n=1 Tax=Arcobacter sp. F2176 TaxID=2044511 RepID=UPI00100AACE1|nr:hypothetical protein [Arcobacter sp. F2176]RXJ81007.1 hypothetical protein CRU95_08790 [Arcobacter sp. F2176]